MSDFSDWWYLDGSERRLKRQLEGELDAAYATQYRQTSDLRSQMARLQGSLEQRLSLLTQAFDAFVELTDVRAELGMFEAETTVRHAAHRLLRAVAGHAAQPSALAGDVPALSANLPRCPGYWLRPAVVSLSAAVRGDAAGAAAAQAEARELDEARASAFLAVALGLAGRPAEALPLLPAALRAAETQVTYAQRSLWRACAQGTYLGPGETTVRRWLAGYVRALDPAAAASGRQLWEPDAGYALGAANLASQARSALPYSLSKFEALVTPLVAAGQLSALSSWVAEAMSAAPAAIQDAGGAAGDGGLDEVAARLAATAAALAEEGSPEEAALRSRARELREVVDGQKAAVRPTWDTPEGDTLALLRADAFGTDLHLRRVALTSCATWASGLAAQLASAAGTPPPEQVTVTIHGHNVTIGASGSVSLDAAYAEIEQRNTPQGMSDKLFHRKELEESTARQEERVARDAQAAGQAVRDRVAQLRAAGERARADRDSVVAALVRDDT